MTPKPRVCRRLVFDDLDNSAAAGTETADLRPEMGNGLLNSPELRSYLENAKQRWNFDFENEVPMDGRWQWEKVEMSEPPTVEGKANAENEESELDADRPEH
jgi:hypothetical protein